jgi:hypothetical protein
MPKAFVITTCIQIFDIDTNEILDIATLPHFVTEKINCFDKFEEHGIAGKERLVHLAPFSFVVDADEDILFPDKLLEEIEEIIEGSKNIELVGEKN